MATEFCGAPYDHPGTVIDERWYEPIETRPVPGDLLQFIDNGRISTYHPSVHRYQGDLVVYDAAKLDEIKRARRAEEARFAAGPEANGGGVALSMNPTDWSKYRFAADGLMISVSGNTSWRILKRGDVRPFLEDTYYEALGVEPQAGDRVRHCDGNIYTLERVSPRGGGEIALHYGNKHGAGIWNGDGKYWRILKRTRG